MIARTCLLFSALLIAPGCVVTSSDDDDMMGDGGSNNGAANGATNMGDGGGNGTANGGNGATNGTTNGGGSDGGGNGATNGTTNGGSDGGGNGTTNGGSDGGTGGMMMDGGMGDAGPMVELRDCSSRDTTGATEVDSDITEDVTWSGVVHVTSSIDVKNGAVVTIEPGTVIIVDVDRDIEFGWSNNAATVLAEGTAQDPISFCGAGGDPGYWGGLILRGNVTSNSVLDNVLISDAGGTNAGLVLDADVTVNRVQVRNSGSDGVHATDFKAGSAILTVEGAAGSAVVLDGTGAVTRFPLGGAFMNNGENVVRLTFGDIKEDTTFHDPGIPYLQNGSVDVEGTSEIVFEAGIDYRFAAATSLEVGWSGGGSKITVAGTESQPVIFQGEAAESGSWDGILIRSNVVASSSLTHTTIVHGGGGSAALDIDTPITLDNVSLDTNDAGVNIAADGLNDDSTMLSVNGTEGMPMTVHPDALVTLPEGGDFTGNTNDRIAVTGGDYTVAGTVPNLGVPYYLEGSIDLEAGSEMTIAAGTEFIANAGVDIDVGWSSSTAKFTAIGTASEPIVFTGADETTNGYWNGILIRSNAAGDSALDYVEIHYAGTTGNGALELERAISVSNTTITHSAGYAILHQAADATDYTMFGNSFSNNTQGDVSTF